MRHKSIFLLSISFVLVFSVAQGFTEQPDIDLKKVADKIVKAYTSVDPVAMANLYAEDAVLSGPGEIIRGRKAIQERMESMFKAFTDFKIEFLTVIPSGNHIAFEILIRFDFDTCEDLVVLVIPEAFFVNTGTYYNGMRCTGEFFQIGFYSLAHQDEWA